MSGFWLEKLCVVKDTVQEHQTWGYVIREAGHRKKDSLAELES